MNCQTVIELLPWLGNGTLAGAEKAEVLAHLASCESCRKELADTRAAAAIHLVHPLPEELYHFAALRPMDATLRVLIEAHLSSCATCKAELALITESQELATTHEDRGRGLGLPARDTVVPGPWFSRHFRHIALAAGLAIAVIGPLAMWTAQRSDSSDQVAELVSFELPAASRGTTDQREVAKVPAGASEAIDLRLTGESLRGEDEVEVRLLDTTGTVLRTQIVAVDAASSSLTMRLARRSLPATGSSRIEVWSLERELLSSLELATTEP